jgi:SRSO17 transposase
MASDAGWRAELEEWLRPFLEALGHPARRTMCPLYVAGLIGPGERKSVQPMAERLGLPSHDALHHFAAAGVWDPEPLEMALAREADRLVGGPDASLVIDDTALPKTGTRSVGVAPQYASALGKNASCQVLVSLTLARCEVPVPLALRLFLPEGWTSNAERLDRAGVPEARRMPRTKPEIALAEVDRAIATGMRFGCALADAGYGVSAPFRQGLSARGLRWAVGIPRNLKVYPADVVLLPPPAGSRCKLHEPDQLSRSAEDVLADATWRPVTWRRGAKERAAASPLCRPPSPRRRRSGPADRRQARAAPTRRGGVGCGRAPEFGRDEVLPLQPARGC